MFLFVDLVGMSFYKIIWQGLIIKLANARYSCPGVCDFVMQQCLLPWAACDREAVAYPFLSDIVWIINKNYYTINTINRPNYGLPDVRCRLITQNVPESQCAACKFLKTNAAMHYYIISFLVVLLIELTILRILSTASRHDLNNVRSKNETRPRRQHTYNKQSCVTDTVGWFVSRTFLLRNYPPRNKQCRRISVCLAWVFFVCVRNITVV